MRWVQTQISLSHYAQHPVSTEPWNSGGEDPSAPTFAAEPAAEGSLTFANYFYSSTLVPPLRPSPVTSASQPQADSSPTQLSRDQWPQEAIP